MRFLTQKFSGSWLITVRKAVAKPKSECSSFLLCCSAGVALGGTSVTDVVQLGNVLCVIAMRLWRAARHTGLKDGGCWGQKALGGSGCIMAFISFLDISCLPFCSHFDMRELLPSLHQPSSWLNLVDLLLVMKRVFYNAHPKLFVSFYKSLEIVFAKGAKKRLVKKNAAWITVSEIHCLIALTEKLYGIKDTLWVVIYF